jgi:hypothetical protein
MILKIEFLKISFSPIFSLCRVKNLLAGENSCQFDKNLMEMENWIFFV